MKKEPKLLQCPFCGSEASVYSTEIFDDTKWRAGCNGDNCPIACCETVIHQRRIDAIKTWNQRVKKKKCK